MAGDPGRTVQPAASRSTSAGGEQAAAQVVEDLPARDRPAACWDARAARRRGRCATASGQSASRRAPSDAAARRRRGSCRDSRRRDAMSVHKPGARVEAFEQIVAEQRVLRHAPGQRGFEGVDVVDALADVAALVEQVLIDVGDGRGVGIDADVPGEHPRERRPVGAGDADTDARLQHPVAFRDAPSRGVESRPVERVRQRADQPPRRLQRQLRVGVERDHVADRRQDRRARRAAR